MLKVLIVDDDRKKIQKITQVLLKISSLAVDDVEFVYDAQNAKKRLRDNRFDLMILDIAIPERIDQDVAMDGGIKLLNELFERDCYKIPGNIIGITAFDEVYASAEDKFHQKLLSVIKYDATDDSWERLLVTRVKHILLAKDDKQNEARNYESLMCIVCALEVPELSSVLNINWPWEQVISSNDHQIYHRAAISCSNGEKKYIYASSASRIGMSAAAVLAMKMITTFRPKYISMTGITAGIHGKTKVGDIIAADPCWDWGCGKWIFQDNRLVFLQAPHQLGLDVSIRNKLKQFSTDKLIFARIRGEWQGDAPKHELEMHVGPMVSGAAVLADGLTADNIRAQHRELLGIEMETYGVYMAAEEASSPRPTYFALKSVVDFANGKKNDKYQKYSAFTSARTLQSFTEKYLLD